VTMRVLVSIYGTPCACLLGQSSRHTGDALDLARLGFDVEPEATGRPGYHPATMLKIYLYGYLNQVQSSRRLERECRRNVELMWLVGQLTPDFKTVADFRKDNGPAIRKVCVQFVALCRNRSSSPLKAHSRFIEVPLPAGDDVPAGTVAVVRSPQALRCSMLNRAKRGSHIDPPASSCAIMRRARPYRGENPGPGKDVHAELDPRPGIREQPHTKADLCRNAIGDRPAVADRVRCVGYSDRAHAPFTSGLGPIRPQDGCRSTRLIPSGHPWSRLIGFGRGTRAATWKDRLSPVNPCDCDQSSGRHCLPGP
jgi:hypothetical protein